MNGKHSRLGLLKEDGTALKTCVVRLRDLKRGEGKDTLFRFQSAHKRPYLLVLQSDAISLVTSKDADGDEGAPSEPKSKLGSLSALLRHGSSAAAREAAAGAEAGGDDDLEDGQVFTLGVSLSQVLSVTLVGAAKLCIAFQPNKPTKKTMGRHAKGVLLATFAPSSSAGDAASPGAGGGAHSFTVELKDEEEAAALKAEIVGAMRRLSEALAWLDQRLPLISQTTLMAVSVDEGGGQRQTLLPFPQFGERLALPPAVSQALQAGAGAGAGAGAAAGKAPQPGTITAWLCTAVGPAVATITPSMLLDPSGDYELQHTVVAEVRSPPDCEATLHTNTAWRKDNLQVMLRYRAEQQGSWPTGLTPAPGKRGAEQQQEQEAGSVHPRHGAAVLAVVPVVLAALAYWIARGDALGSLARATGLELSPVLRIVALFQIAVAASILLIARTRRAPAGASAGGGAAAAPPPQPLGQWFLQLESCELVKSTEQQLAPTVQRSLTQTGSDSGPSAMPLSPGTRLPDCIRALVAADPDVLDANVAERFVVGLEDVSKAHAGLTAMVKWLKENDMVGLVSRPQPKFETIKRHHRHGNVCFSTSRDCLVEVECLGRWPQAYKAIVAEGVTEKELLRHLLFSYLYAFTQVDRRPLPAGKTVKIVDLDGLRMSDIGGDGFKFISKAGALLACNFPQRLHRAFLVNAPSWWAVAWRLISPMLPNKVRSQMVLFSKNDKAGMRAALLEWVPEAQLPVAYGGTCAEPLEQGELEKEMMAYVRGLSEAAKPEAAA